MCLPSKWHVTSRINIIVDITDKAERKLCFELAEAAGLDIASITKTVVENIRGKVSVRDSKKGLKQLKCVERKRLLRSYECKLLGIVQKMQNTYFLRSYFRVERSYTCRYSRQEICSKIF